MIYIYVLHRVKISSINCSVPNHPKIQNHYLIVGNLVDIENRIEKDLGCTLSNLVEYNTYENGTLTLFLL